MASVCPPNRGERSTPLVVITVYLSARSVVVVALRKLEQSASSGAVRQRAYGALWVLENKAKLQ